jgi:hypothetical protein
VKRLKDLTSEELLILVAVVELATKLPYEVVAYTHALGELTQKYYPHKVPQKKHQDHNPSPGSLAQIRRR